MILKSLFDRIMSFIGLILLSPIFIFVSLLLKRKMPDGPVIFKQERVSCLSSHVPARTKRFLTCISSGP